MHHLYKPLTLVTTLLIGFSVPVFGSSTNSQDDDESSIAKDEMVAVNAFTANGYKRQKLANGQYKIETYAFGEGGYLSGRARDKSIDKLPFLTIAKTIAKPLEERQYVPGKTASDTDLLIMVYWGTTQTWGSGTGQNATQARGSLMQDGGPSKVTEHDMSNTIGGTDGARGQAEQRSNKLEYSLRLLEMDNQIHDQANESTARLLGYSDELHTTDELKAFAGLGPYRDDLVSDIEDDRYFVTLVACDFKTAMKEKKIKPLWWARYNVRVRGNNFDKALGGMTCFASRYFGMDTKKLIRTEVPIGHVEIGPATVIEDSNPKHD